MCVVLKKGWKGLLIGSICVWSAVLGYAQQLPTTRYGISDGLSDAFVTNVFQDRTGRIWIGTRNGINFISSEKSFVNYRSQSDIPGKWITIITGSVDGAVWAGTSDRLYRMQSTVDGGVAVDTFPVLFNPETTRFEVAFLTADHQSEMWFSGKLWTFGLAEGLYRWKNGKTEDVTRRFFANPNQRFKSVSADLANRRLLLVSDDGRLWEIAGNKLKLLRTPEPIERLEEDAFGRIYMLTGSSLFRIDGPRIYKLYDLPFSYSLVLTGGVSANGEWVFIYRKDGYVYWYDGKTLTNSQQKVLNNDAYYTGCDMMVDRQGNLWASTHRGVVHIVRNSWRYFAEADGWLDATNSITQDKQGQIWFGSWGNGLSRLENNRIVADNRYAKTIPTKDFFPCTFRDADGNILYASVSYGTMRYDGKEYRLLPGFDTSGVSIISRGFYDDVKGNRYILSTRPGINIYNRKTMTLDSVLPLPCPEFNCIVPDRFGRLWLGGLNQSYLWDEKKKSIRDLREVFPDLPLKDIIAIHRDKRGNLWFATGNGLWYYDYKRFRRIAAGYLKQRVSFCQPYQNVLLLGTLEGLYAFDIEQFYRKGEEWLAFFDRENGFIGTKCIEFGIFIDAQERIWVATIDRLLVITKNHFIKQLASVPTGIRSLRTIQSNERYLPNPSAVIRLNQDDLEVQLWEPDEQNQLINSAYSYRLERLGEDRSEVEWSAPVRSSTLLFRNLSDGSYRLTVKTVRANSLWSTRPSVVEFSIAPSWWATWWFRTLIILSGAVAFFNFRLRKVRMEARRRQRILETQKRLTMLELDTANRQKQEAELQQELAEASRQRALLEVKAITNQIDPHFVSNFLTAIQSIVYEHDVNTVVTYLAKFGTIFRNQLMSRTRVFWSLQDELLFVRNYLELEQLRFGPRIQFSLDISPEVPNDTSIPKMLIQGYVSNAIKHGLEHKPEGGYVRIRVFRADEGFYIAVEDNGVGLEKAKQYRHRSTGRGLSINTSIFSQLNQYNAVESWQRLIDLTDEAAGTSGVRTEAHLPIYPTLPPEEVVSDNA